MDSDRNRDTDKTGTQTDENRETDRQEQGHRQTGIQMDRGRDTKGQGKGPGVCISVRKLYLFPPPQLKIIFFPPLATHHFLTPIVALS
jgi:hypothetical protein